MILFFLNLQEKKPKGKLSSGPAETRHCENLGFWSTFGHSVGEHRSNVVSTLCFQHRCSDQNLTLLPSCVFKVEVSQLCSNVVFLTSFFRHKPNGLPTSLSFSFSKVMQVVFYFQFLINRN